MPLPPQLRAGQSPLAVPPPPLASLASPCRSLVGAGIIVSSSLLVALGMKQKKQQQPESLQSQPASPAPEEAALALGGAREDAAELRGAGVWGSVGAAASAAAGGAAGAGEDRGLPEEQQQGRSEGAVAGEMQRLLAAALAPAATAAPPGHPPQEVQLTQSPSWAANFKHVP